MPFLALFRAFFMGIRLNGCLTDKAYEISGLNELLIDLVVWGV